MNQWKQTKKHIYCECKCKFDGRNVIHIKTGMTVNVDVSAKIKKNMCVKNIIFGILVHALVKMLNN